MRNIVFVTAPWLLAASACDIDVDRADASLQYRATFEGSTRGVVLHESGDVGHAGMFGSNCPFDTRTGDVTGDYDLPDENEDVQDGEPTELGDITLSAVIPGTVHVLDKTNDVYTHVPILIEGVVEGRLTFDGVVGLTDDCALHWVGLDGTTRAQTTLDHCAGALEVHPDNGLTLVADPLSSVLTDGISQTVLPVTGDLTAYDNVAGVFYLATSGAPGLTAVTLDGSVLWSVDTPHPVTALDDAGTTGRAAIVMEQPDGRGSVAFHDGTTGAEVYQAATPSPAEDLAVSGNGQVIALVRPGQTFFFELRP